MDQSSINKRDDLLKEIKDEVLNLKESTLYNFRIENNSFPVIGEGSHFAKIMFIGEAPGRNEAKTGKPFCGAAGKILDELLLSVNLKREDIYITNIVKDRPPENRDPTPEEIGLYGPFLDRQIEIIKPEILATLGRFSMQYVMEKFNLHRELEPISNAHGKSYMAEASYKGEKHKIQIIPLYHPAAAIYNQHLKETLKKDFEILKKK